ncbi:efflux transporter outer membrane subunit [Zemynaea arenosa]|uniref:efflux transporter outer membrane subunit n=1 Tax=Zemynaea arenosa TaxID=2561931 RepID=UPI00351D58E7
MSTVTAGEIALPSTARSASLFVLFALCLAGCSMPAPKPPAPTLTMPGTWRTNVGPGAPVEQGWWQAFHDPELNAIVTRALANNNDIRIAQSRLQEYQARLRIAHSAQSPTLTASAGPTRARVINAFGQPAEATVFAGSVQAAYEIDVWGRLAATTEAARADLESQQGLADATALSVAASAASSYLNLRGLDAQLDLARATLQSREQSLKLARRQFEVGYSSRLELSQAEAEYRATAAVVPQLERAIAQQENTLSILLGANPGPIPRGAALTALTAPAITPGLPSDLLRRRPDIRQAERAVVAADRNLAAARDQLLPSLRLTGSVGVQAYSISQLLHSPVQLWSIGGSVLAPLFDAGRLRAQAAIAGTVRDRAIYGYEGVVRNAFAEVDNALVSVQRLREQLDEAIARERAAAEVLRIAHNRYANGYASYLEELDAQRNHFSAQTSVLQLRASLLAAHVDLYRALGGGWTTPVR